MFENLVELINKVFSIIPFRCVEAIVRGCSVKKVFLENSKIQRKTPVPESQAYNFIKKETLAQVFSCEFCEISKNTFSYKAPPVAASVPVSGCFCSKCSVNLLV